MKIKKPACGASVSSEACLFIGREQSAVVFWRGLKGSPGRQKLVSRSRILCLSRTGRDVSIQLFGLGPSKTPNLSARENPPLVSARFTWQSASHLCRNSHIGSDLGSGAVAGAEL